MHHTVFGIRKKNSLGPSFLCEVIYYMDVDTFRSGCAFGAHEVADHFPIFLNSLSTHGCQVSDDNAQHVDVYSSTPCTHLHPRRYSTKSLLIPWDAFIVCLLFVCSANCVQHLETERKKEKSWST